MTSVAHSDWRFSDVAGGGEAVRLPRGLFRLDGEGRARATVPGSSDEQAAMRRAVDEVGRMFLLVPARVAAGGVPDELAVEYGKDRAWGEPADHALARVADPRRRLPQLLELVRWVLALHRELDSVGQRQLIWGLGPAWLRRVSTQPAWRLLVVPQPALTLADWAQADPRAWAWTAPERLEGTLDREALGPQLAWSAGAILAHGLAEADLLPDGERFARLLAARLGGERRRMNAIATALPPSFGDERQELAQVIARLTDPDPARRPSGKALLEMLGALHERLGTARLAARWMWHGDHEVAHGVIAAQAEVARPEEVPWSMLADLEEARGAHAQALRAAARALESEGQGAERELVARLGRLAGKAPAGLVREGLALLDGVGLDDVTQVFLAHLEWHELEAAPSALERLHRVLTHGATTAWGAALAHTLVARLAAAQGDWVATSRECAQARKKLAEHGPSGDPGRYLLGYLDCLDGCAHERAVDRLGDASYLVDGFEALGRALPLARRLDHDGLYHDVLTWMAVVRDHAAKAGPAYATLVLGARALAGDAAAPTRPEPPLYDAARLFPRAERTRDE